MSHRHRIARYFPVVASCVLVASVSGQVGARIMPVPGAGGGAINLPYNVADNQGNTWMIYNGGQFQQQGNNPTFSQSGMLMINGNQPNQRNNQAKLDPATGEVVLENMNAQGMQLTRRIKIDKESGSVRYVDILKNSGNAEVTLPVTMQANLNYGVNGSQTVTDPKRKGQAFAWAGQTGNNQGAGFMFAGKGAKVAPTLNHQQGNNVVQATMQVKVPAGKSVALVHFYTTAASLDQAQKWASDMKESKMLSDIPRDIRKLIVNFPTSTDLVGDLELLRGDVFDVIELRGGDQVRGTIKEASFKLNTSFGAVDLPADRIVSMFNIGAIVPRQLMVTGDGEIFGGTLENQTISIELSNGQLTRIPLQQVSRLGYRKRAGEPEVVEFDKPFVSLRSGDRVAVKSPTTPFEFVTRFGRLQIDPASLAALSFQGEEQAAHLITLNDGSKFSGIAPAETYEMTLPGAGQVVKFPSATVARVQLTKPAPELDEDNTARLLLDNGDLLVGTLSGELKLATAFDTLTLNAGELKRLGPVVNEASEGTPGTTDMQITLWDQTSLTGQLMQSDVEFKFRSGQTVRVPLSLINEYLQPLPQPSVSVRDRILEVVKELNADDWRARDRAQEQLVTMGTVVVTVLADVRAEQPPEAQQRIDTVLKKLNKSEVVNKPAAEEPQQVTE